MRAQGGGRFRQGLLSGMGIGMTISLVIMGVALFTGIGARPLGATGAVGGHEGHGLTDAPGGQQGATTQTTANLATAANVKVSARHLGSLQVLIEADVTSRESDAPLIKAKVIATTDMTEMPGSHYNSNITLDDVEGRPGHYSAVSNVPMVGQYKVTVRSTSPLQGSADKLIDIGTVGAQAQSGLPTP